MFIKRGDGKILSVVKSSEEDLQENELEEALADKVKKAKKVSKPKAKVEADKKS